MLADLDDFTVIESASIPTWAANAFTALRYCASVPSDHSVSAAPYDLAESEDFYDEIGQCVPLEEYEAVVTHARELGLERLDVDRSMLVDGGSSGTLPG